jgi:hypothetical protein
MVIEKSSKPAITGTVDAVCVDVIDLGVVDTMWGRKRRVRFVFETDERNAFDDPIRLVRTYNASLNEKGSLYRDLGTWRGEEFVKQVTQNGFDTNTLVGEPCQLKVEPTSTKEGDVFHNITEITPPGSVRLKPSGKY